MNISIIYMPTFLKQFKKLEPQLQQDVKEKIILFQNLDNHERLRVHKLKGALGAMYSFSVTYSHRQVFVWEDNNRVAFYSIGTHDIYK